MSRKSFEKAVSPPTAVSVPATLLMVVGMTSSRRASSEAWDAASLPLPSMAMATMATVLSGLISTDVGSCSLPLAIACFWRSAMPASTAGAVTSLALMTATAGTAPPGNASSMRSNVCMIGSSRDMLSVPGSFRVMPSAGIVRATRMPPAAIAETSGRLRTRSRMAPHMRDSPWLR